MRDGARPHRHEAQLVELAQRPLLHDACVQVGRRLVDRREGITLIGLTRRSHRYDARQRKEGRTQRGSRPYSSASCSMAARLALAPRAGSNSRP